MSEQATRSPLEHEAPQPRVIPGAEKYRRRLQREVRRRKATQRTRRWLHIHPAAFAAALALSAIAGAAIAIAWRGWRG